MKLSIVTGVAALFLLAGCASLPNSVQIGDTKEQVRAKAGRPTQTRQSVEGLETWEYWLGVRGRHTRIVRFGADGKVTEAKQVLLEQSFWNLKRGETTQAQVRDFLGRPSYRYTLRTGEVWEYRIRDDHARPAKMSIQFNPDLTVNSISKALEDPGDGIFAIHWR
jgi:outer membrane protein assembly factor BamE (lipoprotein component of BamABCDE complex)